MTSKHVEIMMAKYPQLATPSNNNYRTIEQHVKFQSFNIDLTNRKSIKLYYSNVYKDMIFRLNDNNTSILLNRAQFNIFCKHFDKIKRHFK